MIRTGKKRTGKKRTGKNSLAGEKPGKQVDAVSTPLAKFRAFRGTMETLQNLFCCWSRLI